MDAFERWRGWLWTTNEYDWKGRVTRTINTDNTDKLFSYEGCGCAGGQVTTVQGEALPEGRRKQKIYEDILGRTFKTELLDWNNNPYATTVNTFNGRDQAVLVRQFAGTAGSGGNYQDTLMSYDGHGRLKTQHRPEQDNGTETVYNYNADDTVQSVTDARGASANYTYNSRKLVEQISYAVPGGSSIAVTPTVTFSYDNAGNRTQMTDGLGGASYEYNQLSQLTAETRAFSDSLPNAPQGNNSFRLQYEYSLSGQLKSLTDPYGQQINYGHDQAGRLQSVTGSSYGGVTTYISNPHYRAWGAMQSLDYGNGIQMSSSFNNRLQTTAFNLAKPGEIALMQYGYQYYEDGALKFVQAGGMFDRLNKYDFAGRLVQARSNFEARGESIPLGYAEAVPYSQNYAYDHFGNMTQRDNTHWGVDQWEGNSFNLAYAYQNNRINIPNTAWSYDADGRVLATAFPEEGSASTYDAAGRLVRWFQTSDIYRTYDGDGQEAKRKSRRYVHESETTTAPYWAEFHTYYVRSSALGGAVVTEADEQGKKIKSYVKANGTTIAIQETMYNNGQAVYFQHADPSGMSSRVTQADGRGFWTQGMEHSPAEFDPFGGNVGIRNPYTGQGSPNEPPPELQHSRGQAYEDSENYVAGERQTCQMDGMRVPCSIKRRSMENDATAVEFRVGGRYKHLPVISYGAGLFRIPTEIAFKGNEIGDSTKYASDSRSLVLDAREQQKNEDKPAYESPKVKELTYVDQIFLRKQIAKLLTPECRDYIKKLLDKAKQITNKPYESDNVLGLFQSVLNEGGFHGTSQLTFLAKSGKSANYFSTVTGRIGNNATVYLSSFNSWTEFKKEWRWHDSYDYNMERAARLSIHEILHFNYDDFEFAEAVYKLKNPNSTSEYQRTSVSDASDYWGNELREQLQNGCPPPNQK